MRCLTQQLAGRKYDLWMWSVSILTASLHSVSHNDVRLSAKIFMLPELSINPRVSTFIKISLVPPLMFIVWSDFIYVLTRGSIVKMLLKKSMLSAWTSLLWFSKVRERMERRSRSEGSIMHSSRNSSVSFFSSLLRSSQTLKKTQEMWDSFWYSHEEHCEVFPSSPSSWKWSHPSPWGGPFLL